MTRTPLPAGTSGPGAWTEIDEDSDLYQNTGSVPIQVAFSATEPDAAKDAPAFDLSPGSAVAREGRTDAAWARSMRQQDGEIVAG